MPEIIPIEVIENKIFIFRGHRVMLDSDLAQLYDVQTKRLNEAVKRNIERFPDDFMFQLTDIEWESLRSQIATSIERKGGRRYNPYVFTEHGLLMLSNILNSKKAITVSIQIIKVFNKLRELALTSTSQMQEISELKKLLSLYIEVNDQKQQEQDQMIAGIITALNDLLENPRETKQIGFKME